MNDCVLVAQRSINPTPGSPVKQGVKEKQGKKKVVQRQKMNEVKKSFLVRERAKKYFEISFFAYFCACCKRSR